MINVFSYCIGGYAQTCTSGYTYYTGDNYDYCYMAVTSTQNWDGARTGCSNTGGWLVTIHSDAENSLVNALFSSGSKWIGFNDLQDSGIFVWIYGSSTYTNWASGEPNGFSGGEDCVEQYVGGTWNDLSCSLQYLTGYVCQILPTCTMCDANTYSIPGDATCTACAAGKFSAAGSNTCNYPPTAIPTARPTKIPTAIPTRKPTVSPTYKPSKQPTAIPTARPTIIPTAIPTRKPTVSPTYKPSKQPISEPTSQPSSQPSRQPTRQPSGQPSRQPTRQPTGQPTRQPTTMPTNVIPPSFTPTISPTSYPTYTSSVNVYFIVTQVLSGISASNYSSSRETNDNLLKQVVVSMLGYDSELDDISIQTVTDVSAVPSSRLLTAAAIETKVVYTITTPTSIFNDTNMATTQFIQVLNETIATGAFDSVLRGMGSAEWQSVTTEYAIFNTASPTSSPSSSPTSVATSSATKKDVEEVNLFDVPLDDKVAKAKIQYYLGTFVGYFIAIYICLYLYSFLRYGKMTSTSLYDSSYQSEAYKRNSSVTNENNSNHNVPILSDVYAKNAIVQNYMKLEEDLKLVKTLKQIERSSSAMSNNSINWDNMFIRDEENKYSKGYRKYVQQHRTLLGCSPVLLPDGYVVNIPFINRQLVLPPGRAENLLLFICHNHPLFSCFYFMDGSKLGTHGTRILYIGKEVSVFVLYQFSNMLLQYFNLDGRGIGMFINLFVITPSAVSVGLLLKYLYACPFTETVEFQLKYAKYQSLVLLFGRLAIVPIILIMCCSLIIACLFSSDRRVVMILVNYFLYVQFYGIVLAMAKAMLLFVDNFYFKLSIYGLFDILCIGSLYKERIIAEQLVLDVDYAYRIDTYVFGLVKVQKILNRDDAIKAKWIASEDKGEYDIEMRVSGKNDENDVFSIDTIYRSSNHVDNISFEPTENPLNSFVNCVDITAQDGGEAVLHQEYQKLQSQHSDAVYDMNEDDVQVEIGFEEWKTRGKQFKQGTRGSFVEAFQVFETREKLAQDNLEYSASVKNTLHLHRPVVKNILSNRTGAKKM